jgi:hypothetical protein
VVLLAAAVSLALPRPVRVPVVAAREPAAR